jgi:hypothetical protein
MDRAVVEWPDPAPGLIDLATLTAVVDFSHDQDPRQVWQLRGDAAIQMELALAECRYRSDSSMRLGHSSVATARILLHSQGRCTGCDYGIDLTGEDARDAVHIRTVDAPAREAPEGLIQEASDRANDIDGPYSPKSWLLPDLPPDWPGVLCERCVIRMHDDGYNSLLDFRFRNIPSVRAVGRSGPNVRCSECQRPSTFRHGSTCADAAGPKTIGPARCAHTNGDAHGRSTQLRRRRAARSRSTRC